MGKNERERAGQCRAEIALLAKSTPTDLRGGFDGLNLDSHPTRPGSRTLSLTFFGGTNDCNRVATSCGNCFG